MESVKRNLGHEVISSSIYVPWNKCPGNNIFYCNCNDLNLRSLVSIAMHLNPSTNNKVGHFFHGDNHYCYTWFNFRAISPGFHRQVQVSAPSNAVPAIMHDVAPHTTRMLCT
jgi:hypothetical protein